MKDLYNSWENKIHNLWLPDCLETLEELAIQNADLFKSAGGQDYAYIPALNADADHLALLTTLLQANLDALTQTLAH